MRLYEIESAQITKEELVEKIRVDCSDFLSLSKPLYRGLRKDINTWAERNSKTERKPLVASSQLTNFMNDIISKCGFVANRNSIFCCGDWRRLEDFGKTYLIIPKNGFQYTWSPYIHDLNLDIENYRYVGLQSVNPKAFRLKYKDDEDQSDYSGQEYNKDLVLFLKLCGAKINNIDDIKLNKITNEFVSGGLFRNNDLIAAIESENEIMVHGSVYVVNPRWLSFKEIINSSDLEL